jgi:hypothetical protein
LYLLFEMLVIFFKVPRDAEHKFDPHCVDLRPYVRIPISTRSMVSEEFMEGGAIRSENELLFEAHWR